MCNFVSQAKEIRLRSLSLGIMDATRYVIHTDTPEV